MSLFDNVAGDTFAFVRFDAGDGPVVGVVHRGHLVPVELLIEKAPASINDLFADWDATLDLIADRLHVLGEGEIAARAIDTDAVHVLSPVEPRQIFQAAANYRKHVIDLMVASPRPEHIGQPEPQLRAFATEMMDQRAASGTPTVFLGLPSSMCGPFDDVVIPSITEQCDWELELAAVIGRSAHSVAAADAENFVAGYTIVNDVSMRDFLYPSGDSKRGADWLACKGSPTFLPTGPVLLPARFAPPLADFTIVLRVDGTTMQNESTSDMIFGLQRLIEHTSKFATLEPGDILLTGSPAGNGVHHGRFLAEGDVMEGAITGLGVQRNSLVAEATVLASAR